MDKIEDNKIEPEIIGDHITREVTYRHRKSIFEVNGIEADVVMVGDSITEGGEWHEFFPNIKIVNRGISGDTTSGMLHRIDSIISTKADKAFVLAGVNDLNINVTVDRAYNNYRKIVETLIENSITPLIQSILFTNDDFSRLNENIRILNGKLQELALEKKLKFIDLNSSISVDGKLNKDFSEDGLHLNGKGYSAWKNIIKLYF